jgi:hypothetical protein
MQSKQTKGCKMLQDWNVVLMATVDMRLDSCYREVSASNAEEVAAARKLHKDGEAIAAKYRPKAQA